MSVLIIDVGLFCCGCGSHWFCMICCAIALVSWYATLAPDASVPITIPFDHNCFMACDTCAGSLSASDISNFGASG